MGNWIAGAIKHPGALHAELHVPKGQKIPKAKLAKAAKAPGKEGRRARLAETLEGFHKPKEQNVKAAPKKHHKKHKAPKKGAKMPLDLSALGGLGGKAKMPLDLSALGGLGGKAKKAAPADDMPMPMKKKAKAKKTPRMKAPMGGPKYGDLSSF